VRGRPRYPLHSRATQLTSGAPTLWGRKRESCTTANPLSRCGVAIGYPAPEEMSKLHSRMEGEWTGTSAQDRPRRYLYASPPRPRSRRDRFLSEPERRCPVSRQRWVKCCPVGSLDLPYLPAADPGNHLAATSSTDVLHQHERECCYGAPLHDCWVDAGRPRGVVLCFAARPGSSPTIPPPPAARYSCFGRSLRLTRPRAEYRRPAVPLTHGHQPQRQSRFLRRPTRGAAPSASTALTIARL
jgi:hypothetical protein